MNGIISLLYRRLIGEAITNFGRIDMLILNAGISAHVKFDEIEDMKIFNNIMDTNFYGYVYPTKYVSFLKIFLTVNFKFRFALPYLKKCKGQIVVMSSYSGEVGLHFRTPYCASKFAVNGFFESLRMEIKDEVDITIICPITVETSFRENSLLKPKGGEVS